MAEKTARSRWCCSPPKGVDLQSDYQPGFAKVISSCPELLHGSNIKKDAVLCRETRKILSLQAGKCKISFKILGQFYRNKLFGHFFHLLAITECNKHSR